MSAEPSSGVLFRLTDAMAERSAGQKGQRAGERIAQPGGLHPGAAISYALASVLVNRAKADQALASVRARLAGQPGAAASDPEGLVAFFKSAVECGMATPAGLQLAVDFAELDAEIGSLRRLSGWRIVDFQALEITQNDGTGKRLEISDLHAWSDHFDRIRLRAELL